MRARLRGDPPGVAKRFECQTARIPIVRFLGHGFTFSLRIRTRFALLALKIATNARRLRGEGAGNAGCYGRTRSLACE
jgi:hypothetical protein